MATLSFTTLLNRNLPLYLTLLAYTHCNLSLLHCWVDYGGWYFSFEILNSTVETDNLTHGLMEIFPASFVVLGKPKGKSGIPTHCGKREHTLQFRDQFIVQSKPC